MANIYFTPRLRVERNQPLIGVFADDDRDDAVLYFADEEQADAASDPESVRRALSLAGAWSDLDWDELSEALDQIRHQSQPTPPIADL